MPIQPSEVIAHDHYLVHPVWDKETTLSGLSTGSEYYEDGENPPGWYFPTSGVVIDGPKKAGVEKGDLLFFTWNGFDNRNCVSPRHENNIWGIKAGLIGFKQKEQIYSLDYILLEKIIVDPQYSDKGIFISGLTVSGASNIDQIIRDEQLQLLHGIIKYRPKKMPFDELLNPFSGKSEELLPGKKLVIDDTSDVPVELNGEFLYRTRFSELIYGYD